MRDGDLYGTAPINGNEKVIGNRADGCGVDGRHRRQGVRHTLSAIHS